MLEEEILRIDCFGMLSKYFGKIGPPFQQINDWDGLASYPSCSRSGEEYKSEFEKYSEVFLRVIEGD
jgi:hypothetical protein